MSNWWDDDVDSWTDDDGVDQRSLEVGEEEYHATAAVRASHSILSDFRNNDFDINDPSYTRGLVLVGGVFVLLGLVACVMLRCLVAFGVKKESPLSERLLKGQEEEPVRGRAVLVLTVLGIAALAAALTSLLSVEVLMEKIEEATDEIVDSLLTAFALPDAAGTELVAVASAYVDVKQGFNTCFFISSEDPADADEHVQELEDGVNKVLDLIGTSGLDELAEGVSDTTFKVHQMREIRHDAVWPTMALCVLLLPVYLYIGLLEYRASRASSTVADAEVDPAAAADADADGLEKKKMGGCDKRSHWARSLRISTFLVSFLVWMTASGSVTLSALTGDFCYNLDDTVENVVDDGNRTAVLSPLVDYYTKGNCSGSNLAVDSVVGAEGVAKVAIGATMNTLTAAVALCRAAADPVEAMGMTTRSLWETLDEAGEMVSCQNVNGLYRASVWDELCSDLPEVLMVLLASCVLLSTLLLLLWVQWSFMIREQIEGDQQKDREIACGGGSCGRRSSSSSSSSSSSINHTAAAAISSPSPPAVSGYEEGARGQEEGRRRRGGRRQHYFNVPASSDPVSGSGFEDGGYVDDGVRGKVYFNALRGSEAPSPW